MLYVSVWGYISGHSVRPDLCCMCLSCLYCIRLFVVAELDTLYEAKRQMVSVYKKQREDFNDDREKRRHESFKKRIEEKQAVQAALRKEM